jgi:type IV pilus assembly protein PilW
MVGMTVGLVLTGSAIAVVINASRTARDLNESSVQIENGRSAVKTLRDELAHAGFFGISINPQRPGAVLPDPCDTGWSTALADNTDVDDAWPFYVQGFSGAASPPLTCLDSADYLEGTDIVVVRRVETSRIDDLVSLDDLDGHPGVVFIQSMASASRVNVAAGAAATPANTARFDLTQRDGTPADLRRLISRIFFISPYSSQPGDGIPTLKQLELGAVNNPLQETALVEGVENLQLEYGIDDGGVTAGAPDRFVTADEITNAEAWGNVVAVRVHLLMRNLEGSPGYQNDKLYRLGRDGSGGDETVAPQDNIKRRAYALTVRLVNPSIRRKFNSN